MSRYHSYLRSATLMLQQYKGEEPFAVFVKRFFGLHKKHGSRDRKQISHLCYAYFRMGKAVLSLPDEERILLGLFLSAADTDPVLEAIRPDWNKSAATGLNEKLALAGQPGLLNDVFPWQQELSGGIDPGTFTASFFIQPDLFLRVRPGHLAQVKQKLTAAGLMFSMRGDNCIVLSNTTKIDTVIELNREAVVQDYSSQRVGDLLKLVRPVQPGQRLHVWDCCAASGGKSIMAYDLDPSIQLTVSDIRPSIVANLKQRFESAGIKGYKSFIADLSAMNSQSSMSNQPYSMIIADVPCTGSGTWSRTPEQLFYFDPARISEYAALQKKIITHTIPQLAPGGYYLYITCSVFRKENEGVVQFIREQFSLEIVKTGVLAGYTEKADSLFATLFRKPL